MKVLYLTYDGLTDNLGQSQVLPYIVELAQKGVEFVVVSAEKRSNYKRLEGRVKEALKGLPVVWKPVHYHKSPPVLSSLYDLNRMYMSMLPLVKKGETDIIHSRSYLPQLLATEIKKRFPKVKLVFDIRGFWIDERIEGNIWPYKHIYKKVVNFLRKQEPDMYASSDHIVTLTNKSVSVISERFGADKGKISVIPCATNVKVPKYDKDRVKEELGLAACSPVLVYSGSIGSWYMGKEMLEFFEVVLERFPNAAFLWLGRASYKQLLSLVPSGKVTRYNLKIKFVSHNDVPRYLQAADVGLFFIKPLPSKVASSPTKMGEMLAAGLPVIANDIGDVGDIINDLGAGKVVGCFNRKCFEEVVSELDDIIAKGGAVPHITAKKYFDVRQAVEKYYDIYQRL